MTYMETMGGAVLLTSLLNLLNALIGAQDRDGNVTIDWKSLCTGGKSIANHNTFNTWVYLPLHYTYLASWQKRKGK